MFFRRIALLLLVSSALPAEQPRNFLFMGAGDLAAHEKLVARPDISGVQVVYNWKRLERARDLYDFSAIEADLAVAERLDRKLFLQIQDRFFMHEAQAARTSSPTAPCR